MATKNKHQKDSVKIITQKTAQSILLETILSDEKGYLFSASAEAQLLEMHQIREIFVKYGSRSKVIDILMEQGYNYQTALKAVTVTPEIFATIPQSLTRDFWVDIHMQKIEHTYSIAQEIGDAKAMALCDKNRDAAIEKYMGTNQMIDQSKLHLPNVEIGFHPELFKDVNELGEAGLEQIKNAFRRRKKIQQEREIIDVDYVAVH